MSEDLEAGYVPSQKQDVVKAQPTPLAEIAEKKEVVNRTPISLNEHGAPTPTTLEEQFRVANLYLQSGMMPRQLDTPAKIVVALQFCNELGLKPIIGMKNICVLNGIPALFGDAPLSLVYASGKLEEITETIEGTGDSEKAVCSVKRKGINNGTVREFSVTDAKRAGLWMKKNKSGSDSPWVLYPRRMLQMRARSHALKDAFADVLGGCAIAEWDYATDGSEVLEERETKADLLNRLVGSDVSPQSPKSEPTEGI